MELLDLLGKPVDLMSEEEITQSINELRRLNINSFKAAESPKGGKKEIKSNADKRMDDLFAKMTPEQRENLSKLLGGM